MKRTYSIEDLPKIAQELLSLLNPENKATILAFYGGLGAGKTTLTQAIAKELGVEETITSPTFVIAKWYKTNTKDFDTLLHIDAYRIEKEEELSVLGINKAFDEPRTLVIIEWPEKLPNILVSVNPQIFNLYYEGEARSIEGPIIYENKK
jgi:tRNA threonylcarbamoyladenosine biosynthesis protein TsaE